MLPSRHIIASLSLGALIASLTHSLPAACLCLLFGIFTDIDHALEYLIHYGFKNLNIAKVYQTCKRFVNAEDAGGVAKLYLFFHSTEAAFLLWAAFFISQNIYVLSAAIGYAGHLALDIANNKTLKASSYFITMRIKNRFATKLLTKE